MRHYSKGRVGRRAAAPSAQDLRSIARRMADMLYAFHDAAMSALLAANKQELAEELNDNIKPVADWLRTVHFTPEDDEDEVPKDPTA